METTTPPNLAHFESANDVGGQAVCGCEGRHRSILPPRQPVAGSNPQLAFAGYEQAADIVARQRGPVRPWRGVFVEESEAVAVEADEAYLGPQPDEAVRSLRQGLDSVLRQAILHAPGLASITG